MGRRRSGYRPGSDSRRGRDDHRRHRHGLGDRRTVRAGAGRTSTTSRRSSSPTSSTSSPRYWACTAIVLGVIVAGLVTGAFWRGVDEGTELYDRCRLRPAGAEGRPVVDVLHRDVLLAVDHPVHPDPRPAGHRRQRLRAPGRARAARSSWRSAGSSSAALITALFLWPFEDTGWFWAREVGPKLDLGISAGGFAVFGALTAVMQPVWRNRIRVGFGAYLFAMVLDSGPAVGHRALRRLHARRLRRTVARRRRRC